MPISINGQTYYWTAEACEKARISRNTFLRWVRERKIEDVEFRDRRGWRLFTESDLVRLAAETNRIQRTGPPEQQNNAG